VNQVKNKLKERWLCSWWKSLEKKSRSRLFGIHKGKKKKLKESLDEKP